MIRTYFQMLVDEIAQEEAVEAARPPRSSPPARSPTESRCSKPSVAATASAR